MPVVFDLGGVLIDWDPRYLYRSVFADDEEAMEWFLANVTTPEWNLEQDRGRPWAEAVELLVREHPDKAEHIRMYHERWPEMLGGAFDETVEILAELRERGVPLYALTNWSAETFAASRARFPFLEWFRGVVVSGEEKLVKPDRQIFRVLLERFGLPEGTVFIDDRDANVEAARHVGMDGIVFTDALQLRGELAARGLLDSMPRQGVDSAQHPRYGPRRTQVRLGPH
jgi:2-haloacid dehalogenase